MTFSPHIKQLFLLLTVLALHPTVTFAEQSDHPSPAPITFTATPDNYSLLCDSNTLKRQYREWLKSLSDQGDLPSKANLYCILGDVENVTGEFRAAETAYSEAESRYELEDKSGVGTWIADKIYPVIVTCFGKILQYAEILWVQIIALIMLVPALIISFINFIKEKLSKKSSAQNDTT